jgi:hypothetical protein
LNKQLNKQRTMITIHNYEAFALDYIEGELSVAEMAEMEALLSQNPALRAEFATLMQNWSSLLLEADETVVYADANKLLKPLSPVLGAAAPSTVAARIPVFRYARIAAVAIGMLIGGGALYQILPNIGQNDPQNGIAQSKKDGNTINKVANKNETSRNSRPENPVILKNKTFENQNNNAIAAVIPQNNAQNNAQNTVQNTVQHNIESNVNNNVNNNNIVQNTVQNPAQNPIAVQRPIFSRY